MTKFFCDKCGVEDKDSVYGTLTSGGGYEVNFSLCRSCQVKVFDTFVSDLKSCDRLERKHKVVIRNGHSV